VIAANFFIVLWISGGVIGVLIPVCSFGYLRHLENKLIEQGRSDEVYYRGQRKSNLAIIAFCVLGSVAANKKRRS